VLDLATGKTHSLLPGIAAESITIAPRSHAVAYVVEGPGHRSTVWLRRSNGTRRRLAVENTFTDIAGWSPDEQSLALTVGSFNGPESVHVIGARGGSDRVVANSRDGIWSIVWSPDGRWLAYLTMPSYPGKSSSVWLVRAVGGAQQVVMSSPGGNRITGLVLDSLAWL
jgi:Tol biopolymer transport system component